jgi:uncharacterized membrane protein YidH (DUF202 family)
VRTLETEVQVKALAVILIVVGLLGLAYGGVTWTRKDTVVDAGPIEITRDKREGVAIPPIAGGLLVVAGVGLLLVRRPS